MSEWIKRYYQKNFEDYLLPGKVLVIYGPRRSGKTSLINTFLENYSGKYYFGTGEDRPLREIFESEDLSKIKSAFSSYDLIVIDEAQKIPNIGLALKLLVDHIPSIKIIVSGSSSFKLSNATYEPLAGRQKIQRLYPLSILELHNEFGGMEIIKRLEEFIIFGTYPEVLTHDNKSDKIDYLISLRDSYLFRDILEMESIKNSQKLHDLLKLLAFQIGKEVSLNELGNSLCIAKQTVERYLELLEKSFILIKVSGFSRNLRKEVAKSSRYYFLDNGIRNSVINNFNDISNRDDIGALWENFLFIERVKKQHYKKIYASNYFWRTYDKKELDHVEERDGKLFGYEFKWGKKKVKPPKLWLSTYSNAEFEVVSRDNFLEFLL